MVVELTFQFIFGQTAEVKEAAVGERDGKRARRKQSKTERELDGKNSEAAFPAAISNKKCTQLNNEKISVFSNIIGEMS